MLTSEIKQLLAQWVQGRLPDWKVAFRNQNAPIPQRPFVSLLITSQGDVGDPSVSSPDENGVATLTMDRNVVLSVQTLGPDAMHAALSLYVSLHLYPVQMFLLRAAGLVFTQHLTLVSDISELQQSTMEERAHFDVEFRTAVKVQDDVGLIERVIMDGTLEHPDGSSLLRSFDTGEMT